MLRQGAASTEYLTYFKKTQHRRGAKEPPDSHPKLRRERVARDFVLRQGAASTEYLTYFKKTQRRRGAKEPRAAEATKKRSEQFERIKAARYVRIRAHTHIVTRKQNNAPPYGDSPPDIVRRPKNGRQSRSFGVRPFHARTSTAEWTQAHATLVKDAPL